MSDKLLPCTFYKEVKMLSIVDIATGNFDQAINALKAIEAGEHSYDHVSTIHDNGFRRDKRPQHNIYTPPPRISDEIIRAIRDGRKSGKSIVELSELFNFNESFICKITTWATYKNLDADLKNEYIEFYRPADGIDVNKILAAGRMRKEGIGLRDIAKKLGMHLTTVCRMFNGEIRYLKKYYLDGTIIIERANYRNYSYAGKTNPRFSIDQIREIRKLRFNGTILKHIADKFFCSESTISKITVWNGYYDIDPELKDIYLAKYKKRGENNAA